MRIAQHARRRGNVLALVAISLVGLCGFVALAVDLGMIAAAKTQLQNAADVGAMAGVRRIDGSASPDLTAATAMAQTAAKANKILTGALIDSEVAVSHGAYHYDATKQLFSPQYPPVSPDSYNLTQVVITHDQSTAFAKVFGVKLMTVKATAIAAHRPRDVNLVVDFSGSMNDESDLWNNLTYLGSADDTSNNAESVFPKFGHYSATSTAALQYTGSDTRVGKSNISTSAAGVPAIVGDFYQHNRGSTTKLAFTSAPDVQATAPAGDDFLKITQNTGGTYGQDVDDITGTLSNANSKYIKQFEQLGYQAFTGAAFKGYTEGPRYWGKTFFVWPPDPLTANDWRQRFFYKSGGGAVDNTMLWDSSGNWQTPSAGGYVINYKEILKWIKASPTPFPSQLRAGKILFYDQIPDDVPSTAYTWTSSNSAITDMNQRFWKEYIDFALGVLRTPIGTVATPATTACSYGPDFQWGTPQIKAKATISNYATAQINKAGGYALNYSGAITVDTVSANGTPLFVTFNGDATGTIYAITAATMSSSKPTSITLDVKLAAAVADNAVMKLYTRHPKEYMEYADNPMRPRHRMWFGPMTMIQYMADMGIMPGTAHDVQMYSAKIGLQGALEDIRNNHPNDLVSLILFNRPPMAGEAADAGRFSKAVFGLNRDYTSMINGLWFPPNSSSADVRTWDANGMQTPRAAHDYNYNTCTNYGLMLAYNQFSSDSTLRTQTLGGDGRKGSQRIVILQTDGMANVEAVAGFTNNGSPNSYYNIKPTDSVSSGSDPTNSSLNVARRICAPATGSSDSPGFGTTRKPVHIHCIAFGCIVEPTAQGAEPAAVISLLGGISTIGGTGFPTSVNDTSSLYFYKLCTGTNTERQTKLRTAYTKIMDEEVAICLVK